MASRERVAFIRKSFLSADGVPPGRDHVETVIPADLQKESSSMKSSYKIIVASKAHLAVAIAIVAMVVAGGATFGSWAVSSSAGNGYAKALTATNLTLNDASASTVADLYPGGSGAVKISVTNPNAFAVT